MEDSKFQREVLDRLIRLETKIDQQDYVGLKEKCDEAFNISTQNRDDIAELKDKNIWLSRTISAALIVGLIGIVFLYLKLGLGIK